MSTETKPEPEVHHGFACFHTEEGEAANESIREEVITRLAGGSEELIAENRETVEKNLLTNIVASLHWDFHAHISGIYTDQWSMVVAETYDGTFVTNIECDRVEDGLVATWKAFADRAEKEKDERPSQPSESTG